MIPDWTHIVCRLIRAVGSQRRLAAALGVHRSTVSQWVAGVRQRPDLRTGLQVLALYHEYVEPLPDVKEIARALK